MTFSCAQCRDQVWRDKLNVKDLKCKLKGNIHRVLIYFFRQCISFFSILVDSIVEIGTLSKNGTNLKKIYI